MREMGDTGSILEMTHISVEFPGVKALDDVQFDANRGEVHVLLGENGAGKSTIMKVLAGVNTDYEGTIIYKGEEIRSQSVAEQRDRGISIIFQETNLLKNLTVTENIFLADPSKQSSGISIGKGCKKKRERFWTPFIPIFRRIRSSPL
jgi:ABC-type sugar transport system ATPase subunit